MKYSIEQEAMLRFAVWKLMAATNTAPHGDPVPGASQAETPGLPKPENIPHKNLKEKYDPDLSDEEWKRVVWQAGLPEEFYEEVLKTTQNIDTRIDEAIGRVETWERLNGKAYTTEDYSLDPYPRSVNYIISRLRLNPTSSKKKMSKDYLQGVVFMADLTEGMMGQLEKYLETFETALSKGEKKVPATMKGQQELFAQDYPTVHMTYGADLTEEQFSRLVQYVQDDQLLGDAEKQLKVLDTMLVKGLEGGRGEATSEQVQKLKETLEQGGTVGEGGEIVPPEELYSVAQDYPAVFMAAEKMYQLGVSQFDSIMVAAKPMKDWLDRLETTLNALDKKMAAAQLKYQSYTTAALRYKKASDQHIQLEVEGKDLNSTTTNGDAFAQMFPFVTNLEGVVPKCFIVTHLDVQESKDTENQADANWVQDTIELYLGQFWKGNIKRTTYYSDEPRTIIDRIELEPELDTIQELYDTLGIESHGE